MDEAGWSSGPNGRRYRLGLWAAAALAVLALAFALVPAARPGTVTTAALRVPGPAGTWVTSWGASPQAAIPGWGFSAGFDDQTVRNVIYPSVGGDQIRLELTNAFGRVPLRVGRVTVAVEGPRGALAGPVYPVTFGGRASVRIPAGAQLLSDPVAMPVEAQQELTVSIYLPGWTGPATFHSDAQQITWISARGDHAADVSGRSFVIPDSSWYYLSGLVVRSPTAAGTVVAFGDSITDGFQTSVGTNSRWPNTLARRLDAQVGGPLLAVADEGISGNRVLVSSPEFGVSAEARFERDALDVPGVRDIIVLEGINDLGFSHGVGVSAAQLIAGYRRLIAMAHARGLKIYGGTILPYQGSGYYSLAGEAEREAVNTWIRTSGAFDGVIDFDAVMADPGDPLRLNPAYNSGDNLHPNDAGYEAMANAIDLQMLGTP
ncbi:MAG: SGNH/GDSL hydrolase family protein [Streptosporangiaceae bacterium]